MTKRDITEIVGILTDLWGQEHLLAYQVPVFLATLSAGNAASEGSVAGAKRHARHRMAMVTLTAGRKVVARMEKRTGIFQPFKRLHRHFEVNAVKPCWLPLPSPFASSHAPGDAGCGPRQDLTPLCRVTAHVPVRRADRPSLASPASPASPFA